MSDHLISLFLKKEHTLAFDLDKESNKLLVLLLSADLIFILIHIVYMNHIISNSLYAVDRDLGYAEIYQYIKEFWIILLLLFATIKRKHLTYFAWSLLFMYLLMDDSMRFHEIAGGYLVYHFDIQPMFNLRAQDFGELGVSAMFGFLLFALIGVAYLFSGRTAKQISKHLFILIMLLAFFGIVVDMLHAAIPWGKSIWGLVEDGGEMLIMSIIVWYVFGLKHSSSKSAMINHN